MAAPASFDFRALGGQIASLVWVGLRSFACTLLAATACGALLAGCSYYFLQGLDWRWRVLAVVLALAEGLIVGAALGAKRSLGMVLAYGLVSLRLGEALVRLVFERFLGLSEDRQMGVVAERVAHGLERLPLAQAEALLTQAVQAIAGEAADDGWFKRRLRARLLELVRVYTLARFRQEDAQHGGIDLFKVKQELEGSIDNSLAQRIRAALRMATIVAAVVLLFAVAVQTSLIHYLSS